MMKRDSMAQISLDHHSHLPEVATRAEVAEYTRIAVPTLSRWATENKGPKFRKAGGRVLYRRDDVLKWLDSLESGGESA